ncbi:MAG: MBL fold metallo-hydrolase [Roseitalea sp.]|jgi:L-ascorbate metabolism protein UlaG (beta-lactamase superfamily)|nr:MBL fold metallo-hydrolase [Roseitalea sp.]MBO6720436.1 MBL fold metallo-hydrolase [Roseitalea sp.]MBO6742796.1 MBL fold metallo-hydrolase [Roseitalea sp.]
MPLSETDLSDPLATVLAEPPGDDVQLHWLGQAGFVIDGGRRRVVIDPYLSHSLAIKYRGRPFPHTRMMPAPVAPDDVGHVDLVLATHAHTDHLDPGTLPALMSANPGALLLVPAAIDTVAIARSGIGSNRLIGVDAGDVREPVAGLRITATRAAHETMQRDAAGRHLFLGYAIALGDVTIFHSGDTVPYEGQIEEVAALKADLALLPVNGRDAERAAQGVPGNLHLAEAADLAAGAGIPAVIAHHFDMFAFNTVPRAKIDAFAASESRLYLCGARAGVQYRLGTAAL